MDEIFAELQRATSASERQRIVSQALSAGADQNELREMLDYLESFSESPAREPASTKMKNADSQPKGGWAAFFTGLIYRYR